MLWLSVPENVSKLTTLKINEQAAGVIRVYCDAQGVENDEGEHETVYKIGNQWMRMRIV